MDRLLIKNTDGTIDCANQNTCDHDTPCNECEQWSRIVEKLAEYEDKIERGEVAETKEIDTKVDRALAFLDEINEQGTIEYSNYSLLHDLISAIYGEGSVNNV